MLINYRICFGKVNIMIVLKNKSSFSKNFNHIDVCFKKINTKKNVNINDATSKQPTQLVSPNNKFE
jgi:hypothetical protein